MHGGQGADILVFNLAVHVVTAVLEWVDILASGCGCVCFDSSDAVASTPEVRVAATVLLPIVNSSKSIQRLSSWNMPMRTSGHTDGLSWYNTELSQ